MAKYRVYPVDDVWVDYEADYSECSRGVLALYVAGPSRLVVAYGKGMWRKVRRLDD